MYRYIEKKGFTECLTNFIGDSEGLSLEDLVAELKEQNIDVSQLEHDIEEIVKHGSEEMRLGWRRCAKQRMEEIEKLLKITKSIPEVTINIKDKIRDFIKDAYGPGALDHAEAYFRNKGDLSERDIMNLLKDLEQLDLLEKLDSKKDL